MVCAEHRSSLPRYADGELPPGEARRLKAHLRECASCRRTLRLLRLEDEAVRRALLAAAPRREPPLFRRLSRAGLAAALVLAVSLTGLYGIYRTLLPGPSPERPAATRPGSDPLDRPVAVTAEDEPLSLYLRRLGRAAGADLRLSPAALARLGTMPRVRLPLVRPIRLRSVLELLCRFYALRLRAEGGTLTLE